MMTGYRSKTVSPLDAVTDKYRSGMLSKLEANPTKYRSHAVSPLEFPLPYLGNLIGWYKFDEESGAVVNNYATSGSGGGGLLPDLIVFSPLGDFWTFLPGFGSASRRIGADYTEVTFSSRNIGDATHHWSFGIFYKEKTGTKDLASVTLVTLSPAISGPIDLTWWRSSQTLVSEIRVRNKGLYTSKIYNFTYSGGEWLFLYVREDGQLALVRSDGTRMLGDGPSNWNLYAAYKGLSSPCGATIGCQGSLGDLIIYNFKTLTDTEWGQWYDTLRGRYGMSARDGW